MAKLYNSLFLFLSAAVYLAAYCGGCEFGIQNLSTEVNDEFSHCKVLATTLTAKEKETVYRTMCKDHVKNIRGDYSYFQIRNAVLEDRLSYKNICNNHTNTLLAWVPWVAASNSFAKQLDVKETMFYIGKATKKDKTDLCYLSQAKIVSNATNQIGCTLMIFEDDFFGPESNINVLVEVLPSFYQIQNITYEPWTNATQYYKTILDRGVLNNPSAQDKTVYSNVEYGYMERVKLDTSALLSGNLEKLPLAFDHDGNVVKLTNGTGQVEVRRKTYLGRVVGAKSSVKFDLIGQWTEHHRVFRGHLYEGYGQGLSVYKQPVELTKISILKISSTEPVFENPNLLVIKKDDKSAKFTQGGLGESITAVNSTSGNEGNETGKVYPAFYPYFIAACVILSLLVLFTFGRMLYICVTESDADKKGRY